MPGKRERKIRVLLVDDHRIVRQELAYTLGRLSWLEVVGEASNGQMAVEMARQLHPDVVVMDINLPVLSGIEATRQIAAELPEVRTIGISIFPEPEWAAAMLQAGAIACFNKAASCNDLIATICATAPGEHKRVTEKRASAKSANPPKLIDRAPH
jgi:DNA-binding NarL/FixJ family response regulator